ncbi:unnamed protein product [Rotaria sordida]|uniref:Uncharacterized protein n=1 Tax=Rotaria sordida TaxID=392033 RepID=A0A814N6W1_9BILA|nr:unnamed protein product [Rotaria sordida]
MAFNLFKHSIDTSKFSQHSNPSISSSRFLATGLSNIGYFVNTYIIINRNVTTKITSTLTSDIIEQF